MTFINTSENLSEKGSNDNKSLDEETSELAIVSEELSNDLMSNKTPKAKVELPGYRFLGRLTAGQLKEFTSRVTNSKTIDDLKEKLLSLTELKLVDVTPEHLELIENLGADWGLKTAIADNMQGKNVPNIIEEYKMKKLLQLYMEVFYFDLQHGTKTSGFISEEVYQEFAKRNPEHFANGEIDSVEHGVRHRASLTSVITKAFNESVKLFKEHGIKAKDISVYDAGCGTGKPALIARMAEELPNMGYTFKDVVGYDYFEPVLDIAKENRKTAGFKHDRKISYKLEDATKFTKYKNPTLVYAYNPFDKKIMEQAVKNIEAANLSTVFAYNKPLHADCFKKENGWETKVISISQDEDSQLTLFYRNLPEMAA